MRSARCALRALALGGVAIGVVVIGVGCGGAKDEPTPEAPPPRLSAGPSVDPEELALEARDLGPDWIRDRTQETGGVSVGGSGGVLCLPESFKPDENVDRQTDRFFISARRAQFFAAEIEIYKGNSLLPELEYVESVARNCKKFSSSNGAVRVKPLKPPRLGDDAQAYLFRFVQDGAPVRMQLVVVRVGNVLVSAATSHFGATELAKGNEYARVAVAKVKRSLKQAAEDAPRPKGAGSV